MSFHRVIFVIIRELLCIIKIDSEVISLWILYGFELRIFPLSYYLSLKDRQKSLLCYLTHSERKKKWVYAFPNVNAAE